MTTTVQVSKEAIQHLATRAALDLDEAEDLVFELLSMCIVTSYSNDEIGVQVQRLLETFERTEVGWWMPKKSISLGERDAILDKLFAIIEKLKGEPSQPLNPEN